MLIFKLDFIVKILQQRTI